MPSPPPHLLPSHFHGAQLLRQLSGRRNLAVCTAGLSGPRQATTSLQEGRAPSALPWGKMPFPLGHMFCGRKLASFSTQEPDMPAGDKLGEQPSECVFPPPHGHRLPLVELNEPSSCLHLGKYHPQKVHSPNCKWTL